ncbi:MAG: CBS domain-containing protein [Betaproteobacteria bacterium]|jgi:CBS domain-containing protein
MSTVKDCLAKKAQRVISVSSSDTVKQALELMKQNRVRAILVIDSDRLTGIVSQGDCAIRAFLPGRDAGTTQVTEVMTPNPLTVKLGDPMDLCMGLMAARGIRHLPVMANDRVVGVISIGDVVKQMMGELSQHVSFLETYIKGHSA